MSSEQRVEPMSIAMLVEDYIDDEVRDASRYDNRQLLDTDGARALHRLAAVIYAQGFKDGENSESFRNGRSRYRERDANAQS